MKSRSANGLWDPPGKEGSEQNTKQATVTSQGEPSLEEAGLFGDAQKRPSK